MRILSWLIITLLCIVVAGSFLYFLPMTRDLVVNMLSNVPIISNYVQPKQRVNEFEILKSRIKELENQVALLETKLKETNSELELAKLQLNQKDKLIYNLKSELTLVKSNIDKKKQDVKKLVDLVENMEAKSAARIIEGIEEDKAVQILSLLNKEKAGEIFQYLSPAKAINLSNKLGWGG